MKKTLFGTTALVTGAALMSSPALAEDPIKLGLDGYMNMFFGIGDTDNDVTDREPTNLFQDGEIWFVGETTLDNGITFGANVQLEAFSPGDQIDESFGYVSGSFGRLNIGSENTAAYLMQYSAPVVGAPINSGWLTTFIPADGIVGPIGGFRTPAISTYGDLGAIGNDEKVITYFTPRFSGFQVGVSYTPTFDGGGDGTNVSADSDFDFQHGFSLGANYVNSFGGVDLAIAGGYRRAEVGDAIDDAGIDEPQQFSAGVNVGFAGFTVGGSLLVEDSDFTTDGTAWDAGASYSTGPWSVGASVFSSETDGADLEVLAFQGGVAYAVGPGIEASGTIMYGDIEDDTAEADGVVAIFGMAYSF